ncbi:MAG: pyruvate kinase [Alphaproteobacteria bacterium]|nr:pyruvate kinase [Alphaproteobacteria bacterium]
MSRTRIVATIGPATNNGEALRALAKAGMNVARLNGSHADLDWHAATIALIRETLPEHPILLDIPGRKIRTGMLAFEPTFEKNDVIVLTTEDGHDGSEKVPVNYPELHGDLSPGDIILADDGTLRFQVERIEGRDIFCRADAAGQLKSRKGINVPHVRLRTKLVTDRDRGMVEFAKTNGVDFIGISFVESAAHIEAIRELTGGHTPRIVSKVENKGGLDNLAEVVDATDAVMIDRGDLSVETSLEELSLFQKRILEVASEHGKPVIVATEILHTMIDNPFPTKAEVSDITNAVLDGCAATMLSGETAIGANPVEAVAVMRRISDVAANHMQAALDTDRAARVSSVPQAMEDAVALICRELPITKIVAVTISGYAARMVTSRRPRQPVLAVSNDRAAARSFNLLPGTEGVHVDIPFPRNSTDHIVQCLENLWQRGKLADDDLVLVTSVGYPRSGTRMNLIQTHYVRDLVEALRWAR